MNNKKGEIGLGVIMVTFIAVLVGVILFQAVAQQVGTTTNTLTLENDSNVAGVNGTTFYITDYRAISDVVIVNNTEGTVIGSGNYTVTNNVVYNGALAVSVLVIDEAYESNTWYVSGTAQPTTYISDSGSRAVAGLISIFFALMVAIIALTPTLQSKLLEMMGK